MSKIAIITGSTKGIGLAVSTRLLENGYKVYMSYSADDVSAELIRQKLSKKFAVDCFVIDKVDLSDYENAKRYISKLKSELSGIDVLVFNATATDKTSFENLSLESFEKIIRINVTIPFLLTQSLVSELKNGVDKCVVFMGSTMGIYAHATSIAYGVSKSAEHSLAKNLVKFLSSYGIRSNAIAPSFVETAMQKDKPNTVRDSILNKLALHRFANPKEIADAVLFIINNQYINGTILEIDAGYCYK
jgi:3-oxoacyl-[acyl-carrier protein] reductase